MKFLLSGQAIQRKLSSLIRNCRQMEWAVAWASVGHPVFELLNENRDKIAKLSIGVDFYQTHPDFLKQFINCENVRIAKKTNGIFHPKVYFFEMDDGWECVLGSANCTYSAFSKNEEVAVLINDRDTDSELELIRLKGNLSNLFESGEVITRQFVQKYRNLWVKNRPKISKLTNDYGVKKSSKHVVDSLISSMSWEEFFGAIREEGKLSLDQRVQLLGKVQGWLKKDSLVNLDVDTRQKIGGYYGVSETQDWGWFGSMVGSGVFKNRMNEDCGLISEALDQIPFSGEVTKKHYDRFVEKYCECFTEGFIGTGTRLLAMKRPDYFVCLDNANKRAFCRDFGISVSGLNLMNYWDEAVERIIDCVWWSVDKPEGELAQRIWEGRAALVDVLYYSDEEYLSSN